MLSPLFGGVFMTETYLYPKQHRHDCGTKVRGQGVSLQLQDGKETLVSIMCHWEDSAPDHTTDFSFFFKLFIYF